MRNTQRTRHAHPTETTAGEPRLRTHAATADGSEERRAACEADMRVDAHRRPALPSVCIALVLVRTFVSWLMDGKGAQQ
jgi:hypothetical protein